MCGKSWTGDKTRIQSSEIRSPATITDTLQARNVPTYIISNMPAIVEVTSQSLFLKSDVNVSEI
jgi:hypothetical protein